VADTPENLRLKQQSELQSQVKYKRDFEESKGRGFSIVTDTPELQRLKRTQEQISNVGDCLFGDAIAVTRVSGWENGLGLGSVLGATVCKGVLSMLLKYARCNC